MTSSFAFAVFLAVLFQDPGVQRTSIPAQLGVSLSSDTVTVGDQFVAVVRVRGPRGSTIEFPQAIDSSVTVLPTGMQLVGKPVTQQIPDSTGTTVSTAYRLTAWDTGPQPLGLGDAMIVSGSDTGYVSLGDRSVFVRSVLPADSTLHDPKPARAPIGIATFDWKPLLLAALALAIAMLIWRAWIWYRNRRDRLADPFAIAEAEFARVEALRLVEGGRPGSHAAMMTDIMREYLAARIDSIERSHTSSELLAVSPDLRASSQGLGELLWRTDLIKFANMPVEGDEAHRLGESARGIVRAVESAMIEQEKATEKAA